MLKRCLYSGHTAVYPKIIAYLFIAILSLFTPYIHATTDNLYGVGLAYAGGPFGIENAHLTSGARGTFDDYFSAKKWYHLQVFAQASAAYYGSSYTPLRSEYDDNLWVYAIAPVVRYHVSPNTAVDPFIDLSSGPGYLSTIHYENRNLGIHFTFQDMAAIGALFGEDHRFAAMIQMVHYSNAGISSHNRGLSLPLVLSASYQF